MFSALGGAVLGAFSWTITLATKFIGVTLGAFVRMLIPRSWAKDAVQLFQWIVAIPNYAGTISTPGGGHVYGFAGVNDLRELFQWLGIGLLPLTLVYATSRAMLGRGDHVAAPVARVVILAALLACYPYVWEQGAALTNQMTHLILSPAPVISGIHKLMAYAVDGVALGGWQLIDLSLMAAIGIELLALIFAKVVIILLGALLFATGPLMIGLIPTESGAVIARAWIAAATTLLMLPVVWAAVFAVGAVLIDDASTAGPLIGGSTPIGTLLGGVIVAVAGVATLWLCLKAAREIGGLLRLQLGGLLVIAGRGSSRTSSAPAPAGGSGRLARRPRGRSARFQGKVSAAGSAALDAAGPRTAAACPQRARTVGRRGSAAQQPRRRGQRRPRRRTRRGPLCGAAAPPARTSPWPRDRRDSDRHARLPRRPRRRRRVTDGAGRHRPPGNSTNRATSRTTAPMTRQSAAAAGRAEASTPRGAEAHPSHRAPPRPPRRAGALHPQRLRGAPSGTQRTAAPRATAAPSSGARDSARPAGSPRPAGNGTPAAPVRSAADRTAPAGETNGAGRASRTPVSRPPTSTSRSPSRTAPANDRPATNHTAPPPAPERSRQTPASSHTLRKPRPRATPPSPPSGREG